MPNKFIKYKDGSEYSGKVEYHYIGEFSKGEQHGKGKELGEAGYSYKKQDKPKWKKVEHINGKIKN